MLERRRLVEPERDVGDVVEVAVLLERRDHHPIERKRGQDDEECDPEEKRGLAERAGNGCATCQISRRRMKRSMKITTTSSTGSMNSEMAAPCDTSPETMPV